MEDCDAMNVIDKLNEEFDEVVEKNIQLEKENLKLHKEIHKLKLKMICEDDDSYMCWGLSWCDAEYYGQNEFEWSQELSDAVDYGLEKNIILKEIYFGDPEVIKEWEDGGIWWRENLPEIDENGRDVYGEKVNFIDTFKGGVYH
tara:strand:- start:1720 stop:2151 length:432 start_codon:yes stop_codon:yes gene_type:complete